MDKHKEIEKILEEFKVVSTKEFEEKNTNEKNDYWYSLEEYHKNIATAIEKIYDIKYLDRDEVEKKLRANLSAGQDQWHVGVFGIQRAVDAILKLAIPECKKCKELVHDNWGKQEEISKLKTKYKELEKTLDRVKLDKKLMIEEVHKLKAELDRLEILTKQQQEWLGEIDKLKAKLIDCHNKNTELKGDIAKGNVMADKKAFKRMAKKRRIYANHLSVVLRGKNIKIKELEKYSKEAIDELILENIKLKKTLSGISNGFKSLEVIG